MKNSIEERRTNQIDGDLRVDPEPGVHANSLFCGGVVSNVIHR